MLGAIVAGAAKLVGVAAVAVVANEVWQAVKPKVAEALTDLSLGFLDDSEDEAEGSKVAHDAWAEATRG